MLGVDNHIVSSHSINKLAKTLEDVDINEKEDRSNEKNNEVSSQLITNYSILAGEKKSGSLFPVPFSHKALNVDKPLKNERSISLSFRSKFNFWSLTSFYERSVYFSKSMPARGHRATVWFAWEVFMLLKHVWIRCSYGFACVFSSFFFFLTRSAVENSCRDLM